MIEEIFKFSIIYYVVLFMYYFVGGPKTKSTFWLSLTPLWVIIFPIIHLTKWYKTLK